MQDIIQGQKEQSETAIFWQEIEKSLPKSKEMSALGTKPVFIAFKAAYPSIKQYLLKQILQALIEREENRLKECEQCDNREIHDTDPWNQAKRDTITHLKQLLDNLQ